MFDFTDRVNFERLDLLLKFDLISTASAKTYIINKLY